MKAGKTSLVLVHLSSLDAFADYHSMEDPEFLETWALVERIAKAAINHDGPLVVVDQDWPPLGAHSRPRFFLEDAISRSGRKVYRIHFDEAESDWAPFLQKLKKVLKKIGVTKVVLGGVWFEQDQSSGYVTATYQYLAKYFQTKVASDLVGMTRDFNPCGLHTWTYQEVLKDFTKVL